MLREIKTLWEITDQKQKFINVKVQQPDYEQ